MAISLESSLTVISRRSASLLPKTLAIRPIHSLTITPSRSKSPTFSSSDPLIRFKRGRNSCKRRLSNSACTFFSYRGPAGSIFFMSFSNLSIARPSAPRSRPILCIILPADSTDLAETTIQSPSISFPTRASATRWTFLSQNGPDLLTTSSILWLLDSTRPFSSVNIRKTSNNTGENSLGVSMS